MASKSARKIAKKPRRATAARKSQPAGLAGERQRFVNLDANGNPTSGEHTWVYDRSTGLIWARSVLPIDETFDDAPKACAKVLFKGHACRAGTAHERFTINDFTRHSPALDTAHFAKDSGWEWTSTPDVEFATASSPSGFAWVLLLGDGLCLRNRRCHRYHVRPVLAGQSLGFDF